MEWNDYKKILCENAEDGFSKSTVGFLFMRPIPTENDPNIMELSIHDILITNKVSITIQDISDIFHDNEYLNIIIDFKKSISEDLVQAWEFIKNYKKEADENYEFDNKLPAMSVIVLPDEKLMKDNLFYLELQLPLLTSLTATSYNSFATAISLVFDMKRCSIHECEAEDFERVRLEIANEKAQEEKIEKNIESKLEKEAEQIRMSRELEDKILEAGLKKTTRIDQDRYKDEDNNG